MTASASRNGGWPHGADEDRAARRRRRAKAIAIAAGSVAVEAACAWRRGYGLGGNVVVRCRQGHLFTTLWIPGASIKALRLGPWRLQRCPVGPHWSIVTPVRASALSEDEARLASERRDTRLP